MDRSEKIGLGVAVVGHVLLFGLLPLGTHKPEKPVTAPMDISFA